MDYRRQIREILLGSGIVEAAKEELTYLLEDFRALQEEYLLALRSFGDAENPEARRLAAAIDRQCAAMLFFAEVQGLQMNLAHFRCPASPDCTWPQVDDEDFLRRGLAESMPGYAAEEQEISTLTAALREPTPMEAVEEYRVALETAGMRLAHYWGYLLGNDLLPYCVPGYHPDLALDIRYRRMLEAHFRRAS